MISSHSILTRTGLTAALLAMTTVAVAQDTATPAPSPAPAPTPSGVSGPPDGLIAPPPPGGQRPLPVPQPFPLPGPRVEPAPPQRPAPDRSATPAPRPAERTTAPTRPQTTPSAPTVAQSESTTAPTTEPAPLPPPPEPGFTQESPPPPADTAPVPLPEPTDSDTPEWLPLAAVAALVALLGGALLWRRRRTAPKALPAPEFITFAPPSPPPPKPQTAKSPTAAKPAAVAPAPAPATALGRRADLGIVFEPLSAQSTLMNLRIRYAVTVRNNGTLDAMPVTIRIGLFAGSHVQPAGIAQWFALDGQPLHHAVDRVAAGEDYRFEGELAAPLDALNPITVEGRLLAVPLVAVDARYNHGAGQAPIDGQSARAFVLGREPNRPGAKLAPFRLDQGPTSFAPLGLRDTGIGKLV